MGTTTDTTEQSANPRHTATLEHLDATSVTLAGNIRVSDADTVAADTAFIESIRTQGVLVPVLGYRDGEATVIVAGKRRTLAAAHTGQTLPVIVHPQAPADVDRLIAQWDENERRRGMGEGDRLAGIEQMSLLGMSVAQIAKRTHQGKQTVTDALAVSGSATARETMADQNLTLEQAAVLIEFQHDPEALDVLTEAAASQEHDFDHTAAVIRQDRMAETAMTEAIAALTEAGITSIERPDYDSKTAGLDRLVDADSGERITAEGHAACPGHAVWLEYRRWGSNPGIIQNAVCTEPKVNGHKDQWASTGVQSRGPMSEQEKAERRTLIANNKLWDAATEVRRTFLTKIAQRKTPPSGAEAIISAALAQVGTYRSNTNPAQAWEALALDATKVGKEVTAKSTTAKRHTVIALAVVLGTWEADAGRHTWRNPSPWDTRIMNALTGWGYTPSDVEALVSTHATT